MLCAIVNIKPVIVFPVVLTCGDSKPNDLEFLEELINDLNNALKNGVQDGERILSVTIRCVVCDAPARALVKDNLQLRTDHSFREQIRRNIIVV